MSDRDRFQKLDQGGAIYELPSTDFESDSTKGLKGAEWTSNKPVRPTRKEIYDSGLEAMIDHGVQVYFVDRKTFEEVKTSEDHGLSILQNAQSENQRLNFNVRPLDERV